jgi:predicted PurR-regulated permease PerM
MLRSQAWVWLARGAGAAAGVLFVATVVVVLLGASHVLVLVAISILLAAGLEPPVGWVRGRTGLGRSTTILLVYAGFMVLVATLVLLIVPAAMSQLAESSNRLPLLLADVRAFAADIRPAVVSDGLVGTIDALSSTLRDTEAEPDPEDLVNAGLAVADAAISVITVLTLVFVWLTGHQRIFLVVVSLTVGAATGGLVGALLAVPFVAALVVIPERAQDREKRVTLEGHGGADALSGEEREQMETVAPSRPPPAGPGV